MKIRDHQKEFKSFLTEGRQGPSAQLTSLVRSQVEMELGCSVFFVITKIFVIQLFFGILTLLICPQYGLSLNGFEVVFNFFHTHFGMMVCMSLCGGIFMGTGAFAASILMTELEAKKTRKHILETYFLIGFSNVLILHFFVGDHSLFLSMAWFLGGIIGGMGLFLVGSLTLRPLIQSKGSL